MVTRVTPRPTNPYGPDPSTLMLTINSHILL
jgi:hypothetical protein